MQSGEGAKKLLHKMAEDDPKLLYNKTTFASLSLCAFALKLPILKNLFNVG